jgi:proline-specific peptidase
MWPYKVNAVFNAGATIYDGKVLLLVRAEDMRGFSHFSKAVSEDGVTNWKIDREPSLLPDPVNRAFKHMNPAVYVPMQGPSELDTSGKLETWDRTADLGKITVPSLVIGAQYDTMDPKHMEMMAGAVGHGRYLYCPNGSHLAMYDDQETYMAGVTRFIHDVDEGRFK